MLAAMDSFGHIAIALSIYLCHLHIVYLTLSHIPQALHFYYIFFVALISTQNVEENNNKCKSLKLGCIVLYIIILQLTLIL